MSLLSFLLDSSGRDPLDDFWYAPAQYPSLTGIDVDENTANNLATVWACTRILAATAAALPKNIMQRMETNGTRGSFVAARHRLQDSLHNAPNAEMGSMLFHSTLMAQQINAGNAYAEIVRLPDRIELWPIHHTRVSPMRSEETRELYWRVRNDDGSTDDIWDRDMLHVPSMMSANGIIGKGVIKHARETIGFGLAVEREGAARFGNSARPEIIIKGGKFKDNGAREYFRTTWQQRHGGVAKVGLPAMLPDGADIDLLSFDAESMQYLQTRQHNVEELCRWYGVPPHMVQHLLRMTDNNIEWQGMGFVIYSLMPWITIWEQTYNRKCLSREERRNGYYTKYNVDGLMRGDAQTRAEFYQKMRESGVFSVNDILELEDRPTIGAAGDKRLAPLNFTTLEQVGMTQPDRRVPQSDERGRLESKPEQPDHLGAMAMTFQQAVGLLAQAAANQKAFRADVQEEIDELRSLVEFTEGDAITEYERPPDPELVNATWETVDDVFSRMLDIEASAVRKAAKTPGKFCAKVEEFYRKHRERLLSTLAKPVTAYVAAVGNESVAVDLASLVDSHICAAKVRLIGDEHSAGAADCQPGDLEDAVEGVLRDISRCVLPL